MIRLKKIKIKGFKDPDEEKELIFSDEPISVIYGQNGSGKTTLLKILFGVLSQDAAILLREKVQWMDIEYEKEGKLKKTHIDCVENDKINWGKNTDLFGTSSILFGVHRGIRRNISNKFIGENDTLIHELIAHVKILLEYPGFSKRNSLYLNLVKRHLENMGRVVTKSFCMDLISLLQSLQSKAFKNTKSVVGDELLRIIYQLQFVVKNTSFESKFSLKTVDSQIHLSTDIVQIGEVQSAIIEQYQKGQTIISESIKTAFFETIQKAVEIEELQKDFRLPNDFDQRLEEKEAFILKAIASEKDSYLSKRIKQYLETKDESLIENSRIFRSMLLNIVESAEEPNPPLEAVNKLLEIFNEHLYKDKKLVVTEDSAYIDLGNGKSHSLGELSSGERNLLSLLTLFLIIGKDRNFLMIDEPEISFNIKWQRDFLPLLSRLNSHAQIIVASHSPSIAHENSNYLVELK